jgi:hypothetical protein
MVPLATARRGSPAFVAYNVFMSRQPEWPKGLAPVKRIKYQYRNVQSYDAG